MSDYLATSTECDILAYQQRFDEVHAALYRWDLWAAACLIGGGCSDGGCSDGDSSTSGLGPGPALV